ncbi:MAG: polyisoprenoid-binding protein [Bacteroidetes bacterium]|nr:polyisoprenoid-binding protein [Bacteroidota bacterium]MBI3482484.1 polyisoprenoid-binding protein [Bacteroidota bacterium]
MKKFNLMLAAVLVAGAVSAQTWALDKNHAKLGFEVTHLLISDVEGSFNSFEATLNSSKDDFSDAVIELTADVNTVFTNNEYRDKDLKSENFFDATKFGTLTFKSTSFKKIEGRNYKLSGNMTIHGVTKPVELDVVLNGPIEHPRNKKLVAGFKVKGKINRKDFGVGEKAPNAAISEEVIIYANAEFIKG